MSDTFLKILDEGMRTLIWNKFRESLGITSITNQTVIAPKSVAQRMVAEKQGQSVLPFFNVWRTGASFSWGRNMTPVSLGGISTGNSGDGELDEIRTIPCDVKYDVYFWSRNLEDLNRVAETYLFWQFSNPNLDLLFNGTYPVEMDLHFGEIIDDSPIDQMYDKGLYFVHRVPISLDAWLFSTSFVKIIKKVIVKGYENTYGDTELLFENIHVGAIEQDNITASDSATK